MRESLACMSEGLCRPVRAAPWISSFEDDGFIAPNWIRRLFMSSSQACRPRRQRGFTLVELLVVIAIIGVLVALLLPAVQAAREAARRTTCQNNMKNVALAVLNYEGTHKTFPNGTNFDRARENQISQISDMGPNWVISVLPFMEFQALHDSFNLTVSIKDVRNREPRGAVIPSMLCPSDLNNQTKLSSARMGDNWARGNYAANVGGGGLYYTAGSTLHIWGPDSGGWKNDERRGVMGPNVAVSVKRITDGMTKTIMLGEVRAGIDETDSRGTWAFGHAGASLIAWYGSNGDANGPNAGYPKADDVFTDSGCVEKEALHLASNMPCDTGGYAAQAAPRSMHVGGIFVAMCDGSVQFVFDDIETSGSYGAWGTPWDFMIASSDGEKPGLYGRPSRGG